ncbi:MULTISPECIES: YjdF family protein [Caproicibacterium]|jgi:hypothetical protein|uniref:DUF2992 family protein n=1 Tax=Caproicibacterium lactatifermentans TaxID=2666138 RepID=A0A859DPD4_9FIRM|nr:YjdF family protein [Caproicibacterium lactatifermentans]ARP50714.1 hypothetical protein B6259_07395 [Ruminococcaceae bacterium CPB6]MDD4807438.1 YjdF family protein [Oscillospiraceae bacterium]QKN23556.1 DUF2992 family protein [Caproicibacterium lactatifermentans]
MEQIVSRLTVFFEDPFWVGVCEHSDSGGYGVCRVVFGAEPKDYEVYDKVICGYCRLRYGHTALAAEDSTEKRNPKRMQREAARQMKVRGISTKAQQALKLQQEQGKAARRVKSRAQKEAEKERRFLLHQEKRREKKKGR